MMRGFIHYIVLSLFLISGSLKAGGFIDHIQGTPYTWDTSSSILYRIDPGDVVTGMVNNATGRNITMNAFATWAGVSIASGLSFQEDVANPIPADINASNYTNYVTYDKNTGVFTSQVNGVVIIIFDEDGQILQDMFSGVIASDDINDILGIASPGLFDDTNNEITAGFAIINGAADSVNATSVAATMTHELGHLLNLSHVEVNVEEATNASTADDNVIPTMYPIIPTDPSVLTTLQADDEFSLSLLYPDNAALAMRGSISGSILRRAGESVRGVNVICRNEANPRTEVVTYFSDQFYTDDGEFQCGNLSTGNYTVEIQPISFAINTFDPDPPYIVSEFFNGSSESADPQEDNASNITSVAVTAGATAGGIDFVLNEDGRLRSGVEASGSTSFTFPVSQTRSLYYSPLNFFITVPPGAKEVEFELRSSNPSEDLDLFGRCDSEFSLAFSTAKPIVDTSGPNAEQQAEFVSTNISPNENFILSGSALEACTYFLEVENFTEGDEEFTIKATIKGVSPKLRIVDANGDTNPDGTGEIAVITRRFIAKGDTIELDSMFFEDIGPGSMGRILDIRLYEDSDESGSFTTDDLFLAQASNQDFDNRTFVFSDINSIIRPGEDKVLIVVYQVGSTAGGHTLVYVLLFGLLISSLWMRKRLTPKAMIGIFFACSLSLSCGGSTPIGNYAPRLTSNESVTVTGFAFGGDVAIDVDVGPADSVKDFFD